MKQMTEGRPVSLIAGFTIPILTGNLLQLTYTIADTRIIGGFLGDRALAAVGSTTVIYALYLGFFIGMTNGFGIIIARMFGEKNIEGLRTSFALSTTLGGAMAMLFLVPTVIFMDRILIVLNVPPELVPEALVYIRIIMAGLIVTVFYNVILAAARAIGDSVTPLLFLVLSIGLNIGGDLFFIGVIGTGVWGAGAATVGAQLIALLAAGIYITGKYRFFRVGRHDLCRADFKLVWWLISTGVSMGLMSSLINIGSMVLQTAINDLGNSYIVAQTAARRITEVLMSVFVATGQAMSTYCSQNYGAGCMDRVNRGVKAGCVITCSWCAVVLVIVYTAARPLAALITGSCDEIMLNGAELYLKVDSTLYVLVAVIFVLRHSLQGVGDRTTPLLSSAIEMTGKIVLTATMVPALGYTGVILVEPIVWIIMIIPLIFKAKKILSRRD